MGYIFIILSIILTANSAKSLDPDLGWHLYLGKRMIETGQITQVLDGYSVFKNTSLPNHEWLSDIFLYLIYNKFGYIPLIILSLVVLALIAVIILKINHLNKVKRAVSTFGLIILLLSLSVSFGVRLQIILFLAVAVLLLIPKVIDNFYYRLIVYFVLFSLGNNLHGGFVILSIIPVMLEFNFNEIRSSILKSIQLLVLLFIAISLNPNGLTYWKLVVDYLSNTYYQSHILEWRSSFDFPVLFLNLFFPLSLYIFALTIYNYWKKIPLNELLLIIIFLILAIKHVRFFPIFSIIITPYFSKALIEIIHIDLNKNIHKFAILATILLMPIILLQADNLRATNLSNPFQDVELDKAMASVKNYYSEDEIFLNPYNTGGYIVWTNPEIKVFIDGRGPQTQVAQSTLLEEYFIFFQKDHNKISRQLQNYNISLVLVEKPLNNIGMANRLIYRFTTGKNFEPVNELDSYLSNNPQAWKKEFDSPSFSVYQKI